MHYRDFARSFDSDLAINEMFTRLNELGPWTWIERENDRWGDYISAAVLRHPERGIVKLLIDEEPANGMSGQTPSKDWRFVIQVSLASDAPNALATFDEIQSTLLERVLPAVGARDVQEAETIE